MSQRPSYQHLAHLGLTSLLLLHCIGASASDIAVVAAAGSAIGPLNKSQVSDLFLGKTSSIPGVGGIALIDQPEASPIRDGFYSKVTGKSASQAKSTWAKISFTGKGTPPKEGSGNDDIKKQLASNKNMLGYIDKATVDPSVKVVFDAP